MTPDELKEFVDSQQQKLTLEKWGWKVKIAPSKMNDYPSKKVFVSIS